MPTELTSYWEKLKSRKFQAFLGGILVAIGSMLTGELSVLNGVIAIVVLALGYMGIEGAVDYAKAKAGLTK